jgi:hypothetical protein
MFPGMLAGSCRHRSVLAALFAVCAVAFAVFWPAECKAGPKEACVESHSRGQDMREKGQLMNAHHAFVACAQSGCPSLIQGDCARFAEEVDRLLPTVSFGARDSHAADLPTATVYVDETLVATRLDDGKSYSFDPGKHSVKFVHDGKETTLKVILNQGEKGRTIVATFTDPRAGTSTSESNEPKPAPEPKRSAVPLVVAGIGGAALVTGGVLFGMGLLKVPSNCSMSARDCAAPPGDSSLSDAQSSVSLMNVGLGVGAAGTAVLVGGLVWYFTRPALPTGETAGRTARVRPLVTPFVGRESAGLSVLGSF